MADWDSKAKRFSGMGLGDMDVLLPDPDGALTDPDWQHLLGLYSGIAFGPPPPDSGEGTKGSGRSSTHRRNTIRTSTTRSGTTR